MTELIKILRDFPKKTISKSELEKIIQTNSDAELYEIISSNTDLLKPIISSKTNGNYRYPIYLRYRILIQGEHKLNRYTDEIKSLHPLILENGWLLSHEEYYVRYKSVIEKLNNWLFAHDSDNEPISLKERSFEIFGEEKKIDETEVGNLLFHMNIDDEKLGLFRTSDYCLNDFIPERKDNMLLCENKDIWFDIRKLMFESKKSAYFGVHIDGVVLGNGNRISEKNYLEIYTAFLNVAKVKYLYWGDIDREGLDIFLRTKNINPSLDIELFVSGYKKMLSLSKGRLLPDSDDHRTHSNDYKMIYSLFDRDSAALMSEYIDQNKRLPQEIVSYTVVKSN
jgi:hypothetical protein